jgi:hypothetical protein
MPTASWKAGPPTLLQRGGDTVTLYNTEVMAFVDACETLLKVESVEVNRDRQQSQAIQYYLAALGAKFPALLG